MLFCITGIDKPNSLALRMANREAHIKYWSENGRLKIGGPFTSDDESSMLGSLLVIEVADRGEAQRLMDGDPYVTAGLFERMDIRAWKWLLGRN
jgi:uncharacterized protein YciI